MYKILTLNNISVSGLERLPRDRYEIASEIQNPDAVLLRSFKMHDWAIPASLKAVGQAGAGVNNIPVPQMTAKGICVFNAPGANANAVKELVIAGMLLSGATSAPPGTIPASCKATTPNCPSRSNPARSSSSAPNCPTAPWV